MSFEKPYRYEMGMKTSKSCSSTTVPLREVAQFQMLVICISRAFEVPKIECLYCQTQRWLQLSVHENLGDGNSDGAEKVNGRIMYTSVPGLVDERTTSSEVYDGEDVSNVERSRFKGSENIHEKHGDDGGVEGRDRKKHSA